MQRYFIDISTKSGDSVQLSNEDWHHLSTVLRTEIGTKIEIVDKQKQLFIGMVASLENQIEIIEKLNNQVELPVSVTIACGISKGDKSEWIVQKGTELGASQFIFFEGDYSIAKWNNNKIDRKIARLEKIAKGAAEQSHRTMIPTIQFKTLKEIGQQPYDVKLIAYEESAKQGEQSKLSQSLQALTNKTSIIGIFGPEGGISPTEIKQLMANGFKTVGLGPRILRAETAPEYFLSVVSYVTELTR